ncbi:MAG: rRNA maturation RNase YbeY [Gammaproteobacteria bacterium]|nr:rRNA maturation RNase YbeY [Gammaproteobacteria bacterium]
MTIEVLLRYRTRRPWAPGPATLRGWAQLAAGARKGELGIRVVGVAESSALNLRYRGKRAPTNVLSFPMPADSGRAHGIIGDIVVCAPLVAREAREQGKVLRAHWAHMVIHGTLHLLGFDHQRTSDARRMEGRERRLLGQLGFGDPYGE